VLYCSIHVSTSHGFSSHYTPSNKSKRATLRNGHCVIATPKYVYDCVLHLHTRACRDTWYVCMHMCMHVRMHVCITVAMNTALLLLSVHGTVYVGCSHSQSNACCSVQRAPAATSLSCLLLSHTVFTCALHLLLQLSAFLLQAVLL
jgi:hypothetical protein